MITSKERKETEMITSWTITKDHVAFPDATPGTNANAVGVWGPSNASLKADEILSHTDKVPFTMYDDDGNLYYEGYMVVGTDELAEHRPLEDFGRPNAGATKIHVNGKIV